MDACDVEETQIGGEVDSQRFHIVREIVISGISANRCTMYYVEEFDDEYDDDGDDESEDDSCDDDDDDDESSDDDDNEDDDGNDASDDEDEGCEHDGEGDENCNSCGDEVEITASVDVLDRNDDDDEGKLTSLQSITAAVVEEDAQFQEADDAIVMDSIVVDEYSVGDEQTANGRNSFCAPYGFRNAGSHCYLISIVSQIYAMSYLREAIIASYVPYYDESCVCPGCRQIRTSRIDNVDNVASNMPRDIGQLSSKHLSDLRCFAQLRLLLAFMKLKEVDYLHCRESSMCLDHVSNIFPLAKSIRDFAGNKLTLHGQRDASDVLLMLLNTIHGVLSGAEIDVAQTPNAITDLSRTLFRGVLCNRMYVDNHSAGLEIIRMEQFNNLSVDFGGDIQSLESSLARLTQPTQFQMSWVIPSNSAEDCGANPRQLLPSLKHTTIHQYSHYLIIHIKRFSFDHLKMKTRKKDDYFSFPHELCIDEYMSLSPQANNEASSGSSDNNRNSSQHCFILHGIVAHEGSAQCGHYYSLVRRMDQGVPDDNSHWIKVDDHHVSQLNRFPTYCFGGDGSDDQDSQDDEAGTAFLLFYGRKCS